MARKQRYPGLPLKGKIVHKSTDRMIMRVQPKDDLCRPIFLCFVTTNETENDDCYVFTDKNKTNWRIPRLEI